jgi:hypothetical protein
MPCLKIFVIETILWIKDVASRNYRCMPNLLAAVLDLQSQAQAHQEVYSPMGRMWAFWSQPSWIQIPAPPSTGSMALTKFPIKRSSCYTFLTGIK